jgi:hypothetical protein
VYQSVKDGGAKGRVAERLVPVADADLARDDGGADLGAVLDDLQQIRGLLGAEGSTR